LALLVELGELANEWRGFKFWSDNQKPNTSSYKCSECGFVREENIDCPLADEHYEFTMDHFNPLLEEYVDCLHFILSIGNDLNINEHQEFCATATKDVITLFAKINRYVAELWWECHDDGTDKPIKWLFALSNFIRLGEQLGFTWEQIEQAYFKKNKVNHQRQTDGY